MFTSTTRIYFAVPGIAGYALSEHDTFAEAEAAARATIRTIDCGTRGTSNTRAWVEVRAVERDHGDDGEYRGYGRNHCIHRVEVFGPEGDFITDPDSGKRVWITDPDLLSKFAKTPRILV